VFIHEGVNSQGKVKGDSTWSANGGMIGRQRRWMWWFKDIFMMKTT
jgi:hypothetical protein